MFPGEQSEGGVPQHFHQLECLDAPANTRRNRIARATHVSKAPPAKSAKKSVRKRQSNGKASERPRWMHRGGRRCVEVSISKSAPPAAVDENFSFNNWDMPDQSGGNQIGGALKEVEDPNDPFTSLK